MCAALCAAQGTKEKLREMLGSSDPNEIAEKTEALGEGYGDAIDEERKSLQQRREQLLRTANTDMSKMVRGLSVALYGMYVIVDMYVI